MKIKLEGVRLSFPDLFEAKEFKAGDGKFRYSATFLIEPGSANAKIIEAAIAAVALEAWPKNHVAQLASLKPQTNSYCYQDGNLKSFDGYSDMMFIAAHRKKSDGKPTVFGNDIDPETGKLRLLTAESGLPYAGCYVNGQLDIYAQTKGNVGIRAGLIAVQFVRDGDAFSGASRANEDDFAPLTEGADAPSMASMA